MSKHGINRTRVAMLTMVGIALFVFVGCAAVKYIPVESVRTEYIDREVVKLRVDSVREERLVFIKGDTIIDIREKERVKVIEIHDTLREVRCDTIREIVEVEKPLTTWQKTKMDFGGLAMGALLLAVGLLIFRLIKR